MPNFLQDLFGSFFKQLDDWIETSPAPGPARRFLWMESIPKMHRLIVPHRGIWLPKKKNLSRQALMVLVLTGGFSSQGVAEEQRPRGIPVGIFRAIPEMRITSSWEDNIYKTEDGTRSDLIFLIEPAIELVTHWRKNRFSVTYGAEFERYWNLNSENNTGHELNMDLELIPNRKLQFNLGYQFLLEHEDRGVPGAGQVVAELGPNKWRKQALTASTQFTFNRVRALVDLGVSERISRNNDQESLDRQWTDAGLTMMWALAPKTALLTELGWRDIRYDRSPLLDSEEMRLLAGITWKARAKTEGRLKVGATNKSYELNPDQDATTMTWEADVIWKPRERTQVNFAAIRSFQEGEEGADHYVSTQLKADVKHALRRRLSLTGGLSASRSDYEEREEDYWTAEVGLQYRFPRWFTLDFQFIHAIKRSTEVGDDYDSNAIMLSLIGSL
ncbi:MAG: outer membrane beta-barrel protein [Magnetococcales bacterium]|nr:outer membrane beta-barrel protein [Magnetococcales bacterium]